jgi:signal transduction histidine kinase
MTGRVEGLLRNRRLWLLGDGALALVLAVSSLLELFATNDPQAHWGGRGPLQVLLALAVTLPLLVRVRVPIAVLLTVVAGVVVLDALASAHPSFEPFAAMVIAVYSLGAHTSGRRARVGVALLAVLAVAAAVASAATGHSVAGLLSPGFWLLAAWVVGRIIRGWRARTLELEALTRELEEQRDLQAEAAVAVERGRIARELHDVVAHNVSMMVVQAGAAARVLEGAQPHVRDALAAIAETGRGTVDEMRTLLGVLRAGERGPALSPQPGIGDLERLVESVCEAGLPVELHVEGQSSPLPQALDLSAYRIVQEALTNALRHAGPARARVSVRYGAGAIELEISDDGAGAARGNGGSGHGLVGIRERVAMLGGEVEAGPRAGGGFGVRARLPVPQVASSS